MRKKLAAVFVALACAAINHFSAQTVADWQKKAAVKYPDLKVDGSTLHEAFMALYEAAKEQNAELLSKPNWPMLLADSAALTPKAIIEERKLFKAAAIVQPEERKAFDNLYFGDSDELTKYKLAHSTKLTAKKAYDNKEVFYSLIVDGRSYAVQTAFDGGKLYEVSFVQTFGDYSTHFESHNLKWGLFPGDLSQYNSLMKESWQVLREIAITRFGQPTKVLDYPNPLNIDNFRITFSDIWEVGKRRVTLGMVQAIDDVGPILSVSDAEVIQKLNGIEDAKRKEAVKAAAGGF